ncbi:hypothetical protein IFR05_016530 [Cadophora sp. M221]|nr:hypothetical protein IFR05_016530 [Cadophora sp. M221]
MPGAHKVHPSKVGVKPHCHKCEELRSRRRHREKHGHRQKDKPKYCTNHSCSVVGKNQSQCWKWKSKTDEHCGSHSRSLSPLPTATPTSPEPVNCDSQHCHLPRYHGLLHCKLHSCSYAFCPNYADPTQGKDFCDDHKCSNQSCQILRKANRDGDNLVLALYCDQHECKTENCSGSKDPGKNHCNEHCCKFPNCPSAHYTILDRSCLEHFSQKLQAQGATAKEAEIQATIRESEKKAAEKLQQERDAAEKRDREAKEKKLRIDKMKIEEELKEEKRKGEWLAAEHQRKREMGATVREDMKYHPVRPFATSSRTSGSNLFEKPEQNPQVKPTYNDRQKMPGSFPNHEYATQIPYRNIPKGGTKIYEDNRGRPENTQSPGNKRWSGDTFVDSGPSHPNIVEDDNGRSFTTDSSDSDSDGYLRPPGANHRTRASSTASTIGSSVSPSAGPAPGSRDEYFRYRPEVRRGGHYNTGGDRTRWNPKKDDDSVPVPVYNYDHHEKREMERERKGARENVGERRGRTGESTYNDRDNVKGGRFWRAL